MKKPSNKTAAKDESVDAMLFRAAIGKVTPLVEQNRVTPTPSARKPVVRSVIPPAEIPDILPDPADENTPGEYLSNGLSRLTLRKLRRGNWPIQDRLDLHGLNSDAARKLLQEFLHEAMQRALRCVLVIHGKGINSRGGKAVLKKHSRYWLTRHPNVLGFCDAPPNEGSSGAALVLLRIKT